MKGKISQWKDDKGLGFIVLEDGDEQIFFNISAVTTRGRRPHVDDIVRYEKMLDSEGRLKANGVVIKVVESGSDVFSDKKIYTEPKKARCFGLSFYLLNPWVIGRHGSSVCRNRQYCANNTISSNTNNFGRSPE